MNWFLELTHCQRISFHLHHINITHTHHHPLFNNKWIHRIARFVLKLQSNTAWWFVRTAGGRKNSVLIVMFKMARRYWEVVDVFQHVKWLWRHWMKHGLQQIQKPVWFALVIFQNGAIWYRIVHLALTIRCLVFASHVMTTECFS